MVYKVRVYCVGKAHISEYHRAILGYENRLKGRCLIEWIFCKNDAQLSSKLKSEKYHCFDPNGEGLTSEQFSTLFATSQRLNFVIGGAEGIPKEVLNKAQSKVSFSKFTFPHQMIRLMLTEQVYRSLEVLKGSNYNK